MRSSGSPRDDSDTDRSTPMGSSSLRTALVVCGLWWLASPLGGDDKEKASADGKPRASAAAGKAARDTLAQIANADPGWKVRMEALVRLVKAGPAAVPLLEEALKKDSPAAQAFATQVLAVIRGPEAIRKAVTAYDLAKLDSARLG